jgi:hypothetical protein
MEKLFDDNCETMENWSSTTWGLDNSKFVSPTHSIADSPYGPYPPNANRTIYSVNNYDLTGAIAAFVEFYAQWDIEANYDYVQFLVSENNGATWIPQHGKYTKLGSTYQDYNKPIYDGFQSSWVKETVDLSHYINKNIRVGFRLRSDLYVNADGFYFDDFVLGIIKLQPLPPILNFPDTISFLDTAICIEINICDYVLVSNFEELTVRWEGNEHIQISYIEELHQFKICAEDWTGCEKVTFIIGNEQGESNQDVVIQCLEAIPNNVIEHNIIIFYAIFYSATKKNSHSKCRAKYILFYAQC